MMINFSNKKAMLLCLIGSGGSQKQINEPIDGSIKLMKEAFLLKSEIGDKFPYNFVPYDFGPCSFDIYEDLNDLIEEGIVNEDKKNSFSIYSITPSSQNTVANLINNLEPSTKEALIKIKREFNNLSYYSLISHVYQKYPQFTKASKFKLY